MMLRKIGVAIVAMILSIGAVHAQCSGVFVSGAVCGNSTASSGLARATTLSAIIALLPGGVISGALGGTGVVNSGKTITLGGNVVTASAFTQAGAFATTITATGVTNSTLPAGTHTLAGLDIANIFTAAQTFTNAINPAIFQGGSTVFIGNGNAQNRLDIWSPGATQGALIAGIFGTTGTPQVMLGTNVVYLESHFSATVNNDYHGLHVLTEANAGADGEVIGGYFLASAAGTWTGAVSGTIVGSFSWGKSTRGGNIYGGNSVATAMTVAAGQVIGWEFDTDNRVAGTIVQLGIQINQLGTSTQGATYNWATHYINISGAYGWDKIFQINRPDAIAGQFPLRTGGWIMAVNKGADAPTINGFDLSDVTVTTAFKASGFTLSGAGVFTYIQAILSNASGATFIRFVDPSKSAYLNYNNGVISILRNNETTAGFTLDVEASTLSLGASGVPGGERFYNATSGYGLLHAPTGALGTLDWVLPTTTGNLVGTGDTATVTNTMLAGSIAVGKITLTNAHIMVGNGSNVGADVAMSGDATLANTGALTIANNAVTLAKLATQATNTVLGNATAGSAVPTALSMTSCSSASSAVTWTTNTGFGCNTSITAAAVPVGGITGLGTGVAAALAINVGTAGAFVVNGGALGSPSSVGTMPAFTMNGDLTITKATPSAVINATGSTASSFLLQNGGTTKWSFTNVNAASDLLVMVDATGANGITITQAGNVTVTTGQIFIPAITTTSAAQTGTVCWTTGTGKFTVDTTTTCLLSLEELKDIRAPITGALDEIAKLQPFWYTWKRETTQYVTDKFEQPGLGAHQVESVDPRLVGYDPAGNLHGVRYQQMVALLVAGMNELKADNDNLHIEVGTLKRQVNQR